MPGVIVEYARFVEVQQRRARIRAELEQPRDTPSSGADDRLSVGARESPTFVDPNTTRGTVDRG